jgi:hypothetical protein
VHKPFHFVKPETETLNAFLKFQDLPMKATSTAGEIFKNFTKKWRKIFPDSLSKETVQ